MDTLYLIKDKKGRIFGPYTKKEICLHIEENRFNGEESLSKYPAGRWHPISAHPVFYKKIITQLNKTNKPSKGPETSNDSPEAKEDDLEPTEIFSPKPTNEKPAPSKQKVKIKLSEEFKQEILEEEGLSDVIEMKKADSTLFYELKKSLKLPFLVALGLSLVAGIVFFISDKKDQKVETVRLLAPTQNREALSEEDFQRKSKQAWVLYNRGKISDYLKAQQIYTELLESNLKLSSLYVFLCLTHLELWPLSQQDTRDKESLNQTLGLAKKFGKDKNDFSFCQAVHSFINKKFEEVLNISNRLLNTSDNKINPVFLFYLKAKSLKALGLEKQAFSFLESIFVLKPKWTAPFMLKAEMYYENKQYALASKEYQKILNLFKGHTTARLRWGILEYKNFRKPEKSRKTLESVLLNLEGVVEPNILFEAYVTLANIYLNNDRKTALKYSNKAYALYPEHPDMLRLRSVLKNEGSFEKIQTQARALIYKGDLFINQGNCPQAIKEFEKAYQINASALAALKIGECHKKSGATGQAIRWLKRSINSDPSLLSAYFLLTDYLSELYDFESAREILNTARKHQSSNSDIFKAYANLYFKQKLYKQAILYGERSLDFYTFDVDIYVLLSRSHLALGDTAKAYSYAKKAIEENINNTSAQISYALTLDYANKPDDTKSYFKSLIEGFPSIVEYRQALAEYYFEKKSFEMARKELESLISKQPQFKSAYLYLGQIHSHFALTKRSTEHYKKAISYLREASLLDLSDPKPVFYTGQVHLDYGQFLTAKREFEKVLRINPKYPMIHYYIGLALFHEGGVKNLKSALKHAKLSAEQNPSHYLSHKLAGDIYKIKAQGAFEKGLEQQKAYALCVNEYQKALKFLKRDIEISMNLLECHKGAGNIDLALQLALQITKEKGLSGYPDVYRSIGSIFEIKEHYEKARVYYNTYFQLKPGAKDRKEIEDRITTLIKQKESLLDAD